MLKFLSLVKVVYKMSHDERILGNAVELFEFNEKEDKILPWSLLMNIMI